MKVYIAGYHGVVGSSIWRNLAKLSDYQLLGRSSQELDLKISKQFLSFFRANNQILLLIHLLG